MPDKKIGTPDGKEVTPDRWLTIVHDHYKDTCSRQLQYRTERDRLFFYTFAAAAALALELSIHDTGVGVLQAAATKLLGKSVVIPTYALSTGLQVLLLVLVVRYLQAVLSVEREYPTIQALEDEMNRFYGNDIFIREGAGYRQNYPILRGWIHLVYTWVFPALLGVEVLAAICLQMAQIGPVYHGKDRVELGFVIANIVVSILVLVTVVLYHLFAIRSPRVTEKSSGHHPGRRSRKSP